MDKIKRIVVGVLNEMYDSEYSISDKYFSNKYGWGSQNSDVETINSELIQGELVGYVKQHSVYKNPKNLKGFQRNVRGILFLNGDFYLAKDYQLLHQDILDFLTELRIISEYQRNIYNNPSMDYIAVQRASDMNLFGISSGYDEIPKNTQNIFMIGNSKFTYKFK